MTKAPPGKVICQICKQSKELKDALPAELIRDNIVELIRKKYPDWSPSGFICLDDLNHFRGEYIKELLEEDKGKLTNLETQVIEALNQKDFLAANINKVFTSKLTLGERVADRMSSFGGSWRFLGIFSLIILVWILINSVFLINHIFDPYPFILLNLALSCLAAIQAPVIMMSQNRLAARDRLQADNDYQINLKAELEVRLMVEKMDHLISHQWHRLFEIQQVQTDLMEELVNNKKEKK